MVTRAGVAYVNSERDVFSDFDVYNLDIFRNNVVPATGKGRRDGLFTVIMLLCVMPPRVWRLYYV